MTLHEIIEEIKEMDREISFPEDSYEAGQKDAYWSVLDLLTKAEAEQPVKGLDKARFLKVLDQWEAHAIRGMRNGATAYHQGKIALITDLMDWINREG